MRLTELEAIFVRYKKDAEGEFHIHVDTIAEAHGVQFLCPKCWKANGGPIGTHAILCWSPIIPPEVSPKPGRWRLEGTGLADLTLVAGSSSVQLPAPCSAHFFIRNGEVVDA